MPEVITHDEQLLTIGHGDDCVLIQTDGWACVLIPRQVRELADVLTEQADRAEEVHEQEGRR